MKEQSNLKAIVRSVYTSNKLSLEYSKPGEETFSRKSSVRIGNAVQEVPDLSTIIDCLVEKKNSIP
jgi:hypothetical protein